MDGHYQLGTVSTRQADDINSLNDVSEKSKEYLLHLVMWEPYFKDADGDDRPLWVENALWAKKGDELLPSKWQDDVRHPRCPIKQLPSQYSRKLLNIPDSNPRRKILPPITWIPGSIATSNPKGIDIPKRPAPFAMSFNLTSTKGGKTSSISTPCLKETFL